MIVENLKLHGKISEEVSKLKYPSEYLFIFKNDEGELEMSGHLKLTPEEYASLLNKEDNKK